MIYFLGFVMSLFNSLSLPENNEIENLRQFASQLNTSNENVQKSLTSISGKFFTWLKGRSGTPKWAEKHIEIHKQLASAVKEMEAKGEGDKIPADVIKTLKVSQDTIGKIANKLNYSIFIQSVFPDISTVDQNRLLKGDQGQQIKQSQSEWHLNLGLLMSVYNRTQDPSMKKQIEFLALNYLAKAAPIDLDELGLETESELLVKERLDNMFQLGAFQEASYHREAPIYDDHLKEVIEGIFPNHPSMQGTEVLVDTTELQGLLPLFFTPMDTPSLENVEGSEAKATILQKNQNLVGAWSNNLTHAILEHFKNNQDSFNEYINPPIIVDLTGLIGGDVQTKLDKDKEVVFEEKMNEIEKGFEESIDKAIEKIKNSRTEICITNEDEQKLRVFLKFNISCVCRTEINGVAVLKTIQPFKDVKHYRLPIGTNKFLKHNSNGDIEKLSYLICGDKEGRTNADIQALVNYSGIRLGGVRGREKIFNFMDLPQLLKSLGTGRQMVAYAVNGPNAIAFKEKNEIVKTVLFQRFKLKMNSQELAENQPQTAILGKATSEMFQGLIDEISEERWNALNANPDTRMILQQSLFRTLQHLATAENRMDDFTRFAQAIELAQSEISTILALTTPFKEGSFEEIYKARLYIVPEQLKGYVKAGVTKSAMNTFAGINAAVHQINPTMQRVHGEGAYFEEVDFLGKNRAVREVLATADVSSVDLYLGEFHHNINIHMDHDHYEAGAVKDEIRQILDQKKDTKHLTVAVDVTIDFINSPDSGELLKEFSKEIEEGTLNFVFFRSGQKFDMLGMDNYYGGPFWMVNNGGEQWKGFDQLITSDAHKTDPLSMQWFCLSNKYAPQVLDDYRARIFDNAKNILKEVPDDFKRGGKYANQVRISTVSDNMEPSFIDIKLLMKKSGPFASKMKKRLAQRFADAGIKMHQRSSFGFYHANWNQIEAFHDDHGLNIRINPGLNPEENQIILDFIKNDIPSLLT